MKKRVIACTALLVGSLILGACGNSEQGKESTKENKELVVSTFGISEDKVKAEVLDPFASAHDLTITTELGNSGERFTKLKNNPNATIDVIELAQANAAKGNEENLFDKIDSSKIENIEELTEGAKEVLDSGAGVPYTVNSVGIIYNKKEVVKELTDWSDLWDSALKDKISIPDISATYGPAMVYVANTYKNGDIAKDNGKAGFAGLKELSPNVVKTYSKSSDLANMFKSGEITVAVVADFAVDLIKEGNPDVEYFVPESGTFANYNTLNIPKNAKNKEAAYDYINWKISKELQEKTASTLNEAPVNSEVKLSGEAAENKTYGAVAERAKPIDFDLVNKNMSEWINQWNDILNQ